MYRVAIIGAGQIAITHLEALRHSSRSKAVAIADLVVERAQQLGARFGMAAYSDYRTMVSEQKPDMVIITLPHFLHKEATIWCAEQGCHVMLEKPMAMDVDECVEMNEAVRRHQVVLAVGHIQQFFAEQIEAKAIIASGALGELVMVNDRRWSDYFKDNRPAWFLDKAKSGGGIVINLGSHSIDRIQWMTGQRIARVNARMTYHGRLGNVEGSAAIYMETERGIPVQLSLFGYGGVNANETELLFTKGCLRIRPKVELAIGKDGVYEPVVIPKEKAPFLAQWDQFVDAVQFGKPLTISGEYGLSVMATVEAAYRSHETGREQQVFIGG
ncbi:MAG: gfo/Idh/MocA family oxidoreductase [Paenibacillus sp.]|nr:gfo/Idh/MocA family oxidoreductase [Paenibacillus sp.]